MSIFKHTRFPIFLLTIFILTSCTYTNSEPFFAYYQKNSRRTNCNSWVFKPQYSIVFLSETTHGSESIRELNSCLIRYLIKNKNFKILVLEYDFSDIEIINYYIKGNEKITKNQMTDVFKASFYNSVAMINLIEWLKAENSQGAGISIYGTDNWNYNRLLGLVLSYPKDTKLKYCIFKNQKTLWDIYNNCKIFMLVDKRNEIAFKSQDYYLNLLNAFTKQIFLDSSFDNQQNRRDKNMYEIFKDIKDANSKSKMIVSMHSMHSIPRENRFGEYLTQSKVKFDNYLVTFCKGKISLFDEFSKSFTTFNFDVPGQTTIEGKLCNDNLKNIEGTEGIRNLGISYSKNFIDLPKYIPSGVFAVEESYSLNFFIK